MVHRLAGWISLPQVISWIPHRNLPCSTLISLLAWNQNSKRKERVTVVHTWPPYLGRSCPFETEEQLTAARKTFDWQPVGSLEAWCHQSATRHLTGSAMMSCCCDWYGSKRAVPTQQDFKAGGSIPPWMHPISSDFKADGICLKGIFFSSIPGSSGLVPQLYPSSQAGHWASLLSSVFGSWASCLQDQTQEGAQDWKPLKSSVHFKNPRSEPQMVFICMSFSPTPLQ